MRGFRLQIAGASLLLLLVGPGSPRPVAAGESYGPEQVVQVEEESITNGVKAVLEDAGALMTLPLRMDRYDALKAGGALAVVGGLMAVDNPINRLVQRNTTTGGTNAFTKLDNWLGPGPLLAYNAGVIAIGVASEEYGGTSKLKRTGLISFEAEGAALVAVEAIKFLAGRARPDAHEGSAHWRPFTGTNGSFVSGHAAASFAVATVFAERYPGPVAWTAYTLATAVSFGRMYTEKHWSSDVVAGALLGWGMGYFLSKRHDEGADDWQIRPMPMERGLGAGLMVGKRF